MDAMVLFGMMITKFGTFQRSSDMLMSIRNRIPELKFSGIRGRIRPIGAIGFTPKFWLPVERDLACVKHSLMVALAKWNWLCIRYFMSSKPVVNWMVGLRGALLHLSEALTDAAILLPYPHQKTNVFFILLFLQPHRGLFHQVWHHCPLSCCACSFLSEQPHIFCKAHSRIWAGGWSLQ